MEHLIGNGSHLLRRIVSNRGHLVRTPIRISLRPDDRAWYAVAGTYNSGGWPLTGYIAQDSYNNVIAVGGQCIEAYGRPITSRPQYWRQVGASSGHDPEFVWYQGAYATSASSLGLSYASCEAYVQLCGYRFTIPPSLSSLKVSGVSVKFVCGGGVECVGSPMNRSPLNRPLIQTTVPGLWGGGWSVPFMVSRDLLHPYEFFRYNRPYDNNDIISDTGECRGARDLWDRGNSNMDGGIPTLTNWVTRTYQMGTNTLEYVNNNRSFFIVPVITWEYNGSGAGQYYPWYANPTNGWWACASLWGFTIDVVLSGND